MSDVLIALMCGVCGLVGACCLALVVLHRGYKRQAAQISQLKTELTAQKIAALASLPMPPAGPEADQPEPARRKRHLSLIIGGGIAAFVTTIGKRLRSVGSARGPAAIATATTLTACTVAVALAGAPTNGTDQNPTTPDVAIPTAPEKQPAGNNDPGNSTGADDDGHSRTARTDSTPTRGAHPAHVVDALGKVEAIAPIADAPTTAPAATQPRTTPTAPKQPEQPPTEAPAPPMQTTLPPPIQTPAPPIQTPAPPAQDHKEDPCHLRVVTLLCDVL